MRLSAAAACAVLAAAATGACALRRKPPAPAASAPPPVAVPAPQAAVALSTAPLPAAQVPAPFAVQPRTPKRKSREEPPAASLFRTPVWPDDIGLLQGPPKASTSASAAPWFPERLTYKVRWGLMGVGEATMDMAQRVQFNGRPAYRIETSAHSNKVIDKMHKVRDSTVSWWDAEYFHSLAYARKIREGFYHIDEWVLFDYDTNRYYAREIKRDGTAKQVSNGIPGPVQDALSALYFVRSRTLEVGQDIVFDANTKKNWPLVVKVLRKEKKKTPAGTFDCLVVQPLMREPGIFVQKGKDMFTWLTDDDRKMPVHLEVEVFIGHITATLTEVRKE